MHGIVGHSVRYPINDIGNINIFFHVMVRVMSVSLDVEVDMDVDRDRKISEIFFK